MKNEYIKVYLMYLKLTIVQMSTLEVVPFLLCEYIIFVHLKLYNRCIFKKLCVYINNTMSC